MRLLRYRGFLLLGLLALLEACSTRSPAQQSGGLDGGGRSDADTGTPEGPACYQGKIVFSDFPAAFVHCDPARAGGVECVPEGRVCPSPDGGKKDAAPDAAEPVQPGTCLLSHTSTIPGVHIEFPPQPCAFTRARAAKGVMFQYDIVVDADVPGYVSRSTGTGVLEYPGSSVDGLRPAAVISGGGQRYCICDQGGPPPFCDLADGGTVLHGGAFDDSCRPITIAQGVHRVAWPSSEYEGDTFWHGRNWDGPSDTSNPEGAPFPPGDYELHVTIAGKLVSDDGGASDVDAEARFLVRLVP